MGMAKAPELVLPVLAGWPCFDRIFEARWILHQFEVEFRRRPETVIERQRTTNGHVSEAKPDKHDQDTILPGSPSHNQPDPNLGIAPAIQPDNRVPGCITPASRLAQSKTFYVKL
jgi:hypothetical protein